MNRTIYDIAGIGIGPFNLGLAALTHPIKELTTIFFDAKPQFSWHEGMLLPFSKMQVPFTADLVTYADPTSPFTYLAYAKKVNKFCRFAILEDNYITRIEYNAYCNWVAAQLLNLCFGCKVVQIRYNEVQDLYELEVIQAGESTRYYARQVVIGIGSVPQFPPKIEADAKHCILHSAGYLYHKKEILGKQSVTIIGSGQSAAEIFFDLLTERSTSLRELNWYTRSTRFHPMETSKLTLELTSPDYIRYFYALPTTEKKRILSQQTHLYKGINADLLAAIYAQLYHQQGMINYQLSANCALKSIEKDTTNRLHFHHTELNRNFTVGSEAVVLATGFYPAKPDFLDSISDRICYDSTGNYQVAENYAIDRTGKAIFVQNAELHTHGFNAADLGMGPYRNAVIINSILGYIHYQVEEGIAFQSFNPFHSPFL